MKLQQQLDDTLDVFVGHLVKERQAQQGVAIAVAVGQIAVVVLVLVVLTGVQRQIVEGGLYTIVLQVVHQTGTYLERRTQQVVHVVVVGGVVGDVGQLHTCMQVPT